MSQLRRDEVATWVSLFHEPVCVDEAGLVIRRLGEHRLAKSGTELALPARAAPGGEELGEDGLLAREALEGLEVCRVGVQQQRGEDVQAFFPLQAEGWLLCERHQLAGLLPARVAQPLRDVRHHLGARLRERRVGPRARSGVCAQLDDLGDELAVSREPLVHLAVALVR